MLQMLYFSVVKDFVLIGQHTCPKTAMKEIDELYTVFKGIYKNLKTDVSWTSKTIYFFTLFDLYLNTGQIFTALNLTYVSSSTHNETCR